MEGTLRLLGQVDDEYSLAECSVHGEYVYDTRRPWDAECAACERYRAELDKELVKPMAAAVFGWGEE